ncbi:MAG: type VI secretion system-associated protein TagF [Acidovorax sp.]|jgi:type VI secretion system protein ImpM|nr:type VI secretion system-associated protein TagF [Acidovorax sp.]
MSTPALQVRQLSYFGKIPSRGDFVKGSYNPQISKILDGWLSQTMELLAEDALWKSIYDRAQPLQYVCMGSRSKLAIAGFLTPSRDSAQRRYPLVLATPLEVDQTLDFMAGVPLLLQPFWHKCQQICSRLTRAEVDAEVQLRELDSLQLPIHASFRATAEHGAYEKFIGERNLLQLDRMLNPSGQPSEQNVSVRRLVLALGLLLQPVMASAVSRLDKGLTLPLPADQANEALVATLWLDFISRFVQRADFELAVFMGEVQGRRRLVIGFNGLSAKSLQSVLHPQVYVEHNINIDNAEWVEDSIHSNYALYKLVSYLEQPQLPLEVVLGAFKEVFIG